jgi:hypothetical protein
MRSLDGTFISERGEMLDNFENFGVAKWHKICYLYEHGVHKNEDMGLQTVCAVYNTSADNDYRRRC